MKGTVDLMEQMGEIRIPEIEEKKRLRGPHRWNRKMTAGIFAVCIAVSAVAALIFVKLYFTEERALLHAFGNLAKEVQEWQELWEEATGNGPGNGLDQISLTTVCNFSGEELPFTLGIDTTLVRDADARKMKADAKLSVRNVKLMEMELYGEDRELMLTLPDFFEHSFSFDADRIDEQYNASLFAKIFGKLEDCELSLDFFPERNPVSWARHLEGWQEAVLIEKLEKPLDIKVPERDDRQYRCSQYRLTISADWINARLAECMEALAGLSAENGIVTESGQDIAVIISVEEKTDRIIRISPEKPIVLSIGKDEERIEFAVSGDICFLGDNRSIDDIVVSMRTELPLSILGVDERLLAVFGNKHDVTDKIAVEWNTEILYDETDTSVTARLHKLTVSVDRIGTFQLNGDAVIKPLREEIEPPEGESIRLFEINEEAYQNLRDSIMKKIWRYLKALSIFGL